ncbi:outer membrane protein, partial [Oceanicaulis sp. MMSF_3324]|uniref:outer membrane protein n=1 Tax=Oceanicaulis sp. MMSF_3324 TaxID=3046702 RepID=UPI00273EED09
MKTKLLSAVAVGAILAAPSMAVADEGWYVSGALGYGAPGDVDVSGSLNGEIQGEGDIREKLALGYAWANNWRLEGELAHRFNDTGAVGHFENSSSDFQVWSGMLNLIYDFDTDSFWTPYIGAGLGWVQSDVSAMGYDTGTYVPTSNFIDVDDSDAALGYQLIAGIGWELSRNLTLDTEYRYFGYGDTDYAPNLELDRVGGHEAWIGLRYMFSAPEPAA